FEAARFVAVVLVAPLERERRQPGFAADGPKLVGRRELVGCVERAEVDFHFVAAAAEDRRAAAGAEMSPGIGVRLALDRHRILREYRGGVEKRAMVLAAVEAVAEADPVG